ASSGGSASTGRPPRRAATTSPSPPRAHFSGAEPAGERRGLRLHLVPGLLHDRRDFGVRGEALPALLLPVRDPPNPDRPGRDRGPRSPPWTRAGCASRRSWSKTPSSSDRNPRLVSWRASWLQLLSGRVVRLVAMRDRFRQRSWVMRRVAPGVRLHPGSRRSGI